MARRSWTRTLSVAKKIQIANALGKAAKKDPSILKKTGTVAAGWGYGYHGAAASRITSRINIRRGMRRR